MITCIIKCIKVEFPNFSFKFLELRMMMLKQVFALALLSHSVFGRFTSFDRQLQEGADQGTGNEWQYCEDTCNKTCEPCEQHHVCAEDEIKCGEGPTRVSPDGFVLHLCAKDEICVSDKCGCKNLLNVVKEFGLRRLLTW